MTGLVYLAESDRALIETIAEEFIRFNDNFERLLLHLKVRPAPTPEQLAASEGIGSYVGEPLDELDAAIKEHAELTGRTYDPYREE